MQSIMEWYSNVDVIERMLLVMLVIAVGALVASVMNLVSLSHGISGDLNRGDAHADVLTVGEGDRG